MSKQQGPLDLASLRGSVAVVTGAGNNGIGWGICCHAASELGMHVVAIDLHESLAASAEARLREAYPDVRALGIACDVTDADALSAVAAGIVDEFGGAPIGAVFANAGVIFNHTILKSTATEWATTLNVNIVGVVNTIQAFVPYLQAQQSESIVVPTASIGGLVRGDAGAASYQASKHAVVAIAESLSFELAKRSPQIRVHVLCPCIVASALYQTSKTNLKVADGDLDAQAVEAAATNEFALSMTPQRHAQQVFDHVAAGNFYMITDNVRPYVDHDRPFGGLELVRERHDNLLELTLDNADAWIELPGRASSSIMKGPMFKPSEE